jgi:biopolymer transport protein ExbD
MIAKKRERGADIPSSSLADIAFLLLIFFLVTTTINTDRGLQMTLPPANSEEIDINPDNIITLVVNATGAILLDKEMVEIQEIKDIIEQRQAENPKLIISVKTVRETQYETYIAVIDQLKKANAQRISIAEPES